MCYTFLYGIACKIFPTYTFHLTFFGILVAFDKPYYAGGSLALRLLHRRSLKISLCPTSKVKVDIAARIFRSAGSGSFLRWAFCIWWIFTMPYKEIRYSCGFKLSCVEARYHAKAAPCGNYLNRRILYRNTSRILIFGLESFGCLISWSKTPLIPDDIYRTG